ncbi:MAG: hypothetical protein ACFHU9_05270 [Fluviicola sp.]
MKYFAILTLLLAPINGLKAQNSPTLLLDGLPSGSIYTDSVGNISLTGNPDYEIISFSVYLNENDSNVLRISGKQTNIGPLLRALPSGSKVTILANIGCPTCVHMKLQANYTMP